MYCTEVREAAVVVVLAALWLAALDARRLRPAWSFAGATIGATGGMRSTPVVANGCVCIGFGQGYLNVNTGRASGGHLDDGRVRPGGPLRLP